MIREFEAYPESQGVVSGLSFKWTGKLSIDLAWVATASPWCDCGTQITMCGDLGRIAIKIDYSEFMGLWLKAKSGEMTSCEHLRLPIRKIISAVIVREEDVRSEDRADHLAQLILRAITEAHYLLVPGP